VTFAANAELPSVESIFLAVIKPRILASSWTLYSGSVYYSDLIVSNVQGVTVNGTALASNTSPSLSAGQYYYDETAKRLYVRTSGSADPSGFTVVATFEMYFATKSVNFYRLPTDDTTREVYFDGILQSDPPKKTSMSESVYGAMPIESAQLSLINSDSGLYPYAHECSFNLAEINIYHCLGDLEVGNVVRVYSGVGSNHSIDDEKLDITMVDKLKTLVQGFPNNAYVGVTVDPRYRGKPCPMIYGVVDGVRGVNVNYSETVGAGLNDEWQFGPAGIRNLKGGIVTVTNGTAGTSGNTATRTFVDTLNGINIGDRLSMHNQDPNSLTPITIHRYCEVTGTGTTGGRKYVDHTSITAWAVQMWIVLDQVPRVSIIMDGTKYEAYPWRDYGTVDSPTDTTIDFISGYNTNIGLPRLLGPNDTVMGRVYGRKVSLTIGGSAFGTYDLATTCTVNPVLIIYDLLRNFLGIAESEIDTAAFQAIYAEVNDKIAFASPPRSGDEFPTYLDIFKRILGSCLLRLFINADMKWSIARLKPIASAVAEITDDLIMEKSVGFDYNLDDIISDVVVVYRQRELSENPNDYDGSSLQVSASSNVAKYLHGIVKQKTFESLHYESTGAQQLADRLAFLFGDRQGRVKFTVPIAQYERTVGHGIALTRTRMPGNSFDGDTTHSRDLSIIEVEKKGTSVTILADDQKGVEDNSGDW
jgi:hypothetical protein